MARASDAVTSCRDKVNDPLASGRYSNAQMLRWLTESSDQLMRDIGFPWCRFTTQTVPNVQTYQLPELVEPQRVYVQGRLYPTTERDTLEGVQIDQWDQSGYGAAPVLGSAAPSGSGGSFVPQWVVQTPASLPESNSFLPCVPTTLTVPWHCGARPQSMFDSGYLMLIPAPANGPPIINGVPVDNLEVLAIATPDAVTDLNQVLWFPRSCVEVLAWHMTVQCAFSDETNISAERRNFAVQMYEKKMKERRVDVKRLTEGPGSFGANMDTGRRYWAGRRIRRGFGT